MGTTSTPKTVGFGAGQDPAMLEANRVYQDALARLSQSLDTRKNRYFDPVLLAAAQGFLAPNQTGSFGESLGIVAKNVGAAEEQEAKLNQEIAQQRVAAAGKGVELQRMRARDSDIANFLGGDQPAGPVAGPLSTPVAGPRAAPDAPTGPLPSTRISTVGEPSAPPEVATTAPVRTPSAVPGGPLPAVVAQAPKGGLPVAGNRGDDGGIQISAPIEGSIKTLREYVQLNRNSGKSLFDLQQEWQDIQRKNLEVKDSFVFDKSTGRMNPTKAVPLEIQIHGPGYGGNTYKVSESDALRLSQFLEQNNYEAYKALADKITGKTFGQPAGSQPATGGSAPVTGGSIEERALANKRAEKLAEADTAMEVENRKDFAQRSKDSSETLATANVMRRFAEDPNFSKMTGILNNDKISSGIALLVRDGIGGKNFTIGIPAIEDVMRNANLTKEQQATYRTFLMYTAQMQLNAEKAMKGSTTERERLILGNANISPQDTAETVRRKADLLTAKAQFDRKAAKAFKASKKTADEFLDSDDYMKMYDQYYEDISSIATGLSSYQSPAPAAPRPAAANPAKAPAAGQPSPGFIRGPDGVIRRKKAGE